MYWESTHGSRQRIKKIRFKKNIKSNFGLQGDNAIKFITDHIEVQRKENRLPPLLNGD